MSAKSLTSPEPRLGLRDRVRVWAAIAMTSAVVVLHLMLARL